MKRALLWTAAVLAAVGGIVLFAVEPRDATYWAHLVLVTPLLWAVLSVLGRRLPYRLQWALAWPLAVFGPIAYVMWPNDQWYLYGGLTVWPLLALVEARADRVRGEDEESSTGAFGAGPVGPWGLP